MRRLHDVLGIFLGVLCIPACVAFDPALQSQIEEFNERPLIAVLPFGFDLQISSLSSIKTLDTSVGVAEEQTLLAAARREIQDEARWLLLSRLATGQGFRIASLSETDAVASDLGLEAGAMPSEEQLHAFHRRVGADLVFAGSLLDYGKIRWQWLAGGMFADISWETVAIGLATAWNPGIILGNVGFELLTSTPLWFGGGYVFGVAMRPVRIEARAFETRDGYPVWQSMEESAYAWGALKLLPEELRAKKETQLLLNMAETIESLGDSLTKQGFTASQWQRPRQPAGRTN